MLIVSCAKRQVCRSAAGEHGFVLIAVLWILALLALLGAAFSNIARQDIKLKASLIHKAELQLLADGLVRYVSATAARPDARVPVDGRWNDCRLRDHSASYAVADVAGLLDLNSAPPEMLAKLVAASGASQIAADELAARIVDFRDGDDIQSAGGAESQEYQAAGRSYGAKNAPFETVSELDQVLGMTPAIYSRIAPLVTVHSRRPDADLSVAPLELLKALSGPAAPQAQAELAYQKRAAQQRAALGGRAFSIFSTVWAADGTSATRYSLIEVSTLDPRGFVAREWKEGMPAAVGRKDLGLQRPSCF